MKKTILIGLTALTVGTTFMAVPAGAAAKNTSKAVCNSVSALCDSVNSLCGSETLSSLTGGSCNEILAGLAGGNSCGTVFGQNGSFNQGGMIIIGNNGNCGSVIPGIEGEQEEGTPETPNTGTPGNPGTEIPDSEEIPDSSEKSYAVQVVELVNAERAKEGLSALKIDSTLEAAGRIRAGEIETSFSHTRPDGSSFDTVLKETGVTYRGAGENIAWGQKTPEAVVKAWMNSPSHRANIMKPGFTRIGVGHQQNNKGVSYWVQLFAN